MLEDGGSTSYQPRSKFSVYHFSLTACLDVLLVLELKLFIISVFTRYLLSGLGFSHVGKTRGNNVEYRSLKYNGQRVLKFIIMEKS